MVKETLDQEFVGKNLLRLWSKVLGGHEIFVSGGAEGDGAFEWFWIEGRYPNYEKNRRWSDRLWLYCG